MKTSKLKHAKEIRLGIVKVSFNTREMSDLDERRGHYERSAFLRAKALDLPLPIKPNPSRVITWAETAPIQSCFTHINTIAHSLNETKLVYGEQAAARELLSRSDEILAAFKTFRAEILDGDPNDET